MFITLLVVTFFIAATVTHVVARIFNGSVRTILDRVVGDMSGVSIRGDSCCDRGRR